MASGYIDFAESGNLDGRIYWSATAGDMKTNSSKVTAYIQVRKLNSTQATTGTWKYTIKIGTKTFSNSVSGKSVLGWTTIYTIPENEAVTIAHNADGSGSVKISGSVSAPSGTTLAGLSVSGDKTVTLDNIARYATITSASDFDDEGAPSCKWSNPAGTNVTVDVGVYWDKDTVLIPYETVTGTSGTKTFTLTEEIKNAIYNKLKNDTEKTVYYYIRTTFSDGSKPLYHKLAKKVSIVNAEPTFIGLITPDAKTQQLTGSTKRWIKGYTDLLVGYDNVSWKKGATAKQYLAICGTNKIYGYKGLDSSGLPVGILEDIEADMAGLYLTDSRGNGAAYVVKADALINYTELTCSIKVSMALENTSESESTVKATVSVSGNAYGGAFKADGSNKNVVTLYYRTKTEDDANYGNWIEVSAKPTISNNKYSATITISGLNYQKVHTIQVGALDRLRSTFGLSYKTSNAVADKAIPVFDWSDSDFNFNIPMYYQGKKLIYEADDSITFNNIDVNCAGFLSSGRKTIVFTIPIAKPIFASGVKFSGNIICRYKNGYLGATAVENAPIDISITESGYSNSNINEISTVITEAGIKVRIDFKTAISGTVDADNNSPVTVSSATDSGLTITFT